MFTVSTDVYKGCTHSESGQYPWGPCQISLIKVLFQGKSIFLTEDSDLYFCVQVVQGFVKRKKPSTLGNSCRPLAVQSRAGSPCAYLVNSPIGKVT